MTTPCRSDSEATLHHAWHAFAAAWTAYVSDLTPDEIEAEIESRACAMRGLAALHADAGGSSNATGPTAQEGAP
jgi:hypothetical protein